jgi:hypothetical protein
MVVSEQPRRPEESESILGTSVELRLLPCRGSTLTLVNHQGNGHSRSILQVVKKWGQSVEGLGDRAL